MQLATHNKSASNQAPLFFMPRLYDDTMHLLTQARNYFSIYSKQDQMSMTPSQRTAYSLIMSRISLRLSATMCWVLARRAFHAGQISADQLEQQFRLGFHDECLRNETTFNEFLPSFVQKLQRETLALYVRIDNLDSMQQQAA